MRYAEQRRTVERCDAPHGAATSHMGGRSCAERRPAIITITTTTTIIIIILVSFRDLA